MLRLIMMVILIIGASYTYGYVQDLNPGIIPLHLSPTMTLELSPVHLVLLSIATGALMVALLVGLRDTKTLLINWRSSRLRRREEKAVSFHREGMQAFLSSRKEDAITLFEQALALDPDYEPSLLSLGQVYRSQGNFPEAIRLHRKACGLNPKNLEPLFHLAQDLEEANRPDELLQTYEDILTIDPHNLTILGRQRNLLMRQDQWSAALEIQQRILKSKLAEPERREEGQRLVGITYEVGRTLLTQGNAEEARHYFQTALKHDESFLPAYCGLADASLQEGNRSEALKTLHNAYQTHRHIMFLFQLEHLYLESSEPDAILRAYREALQEDPHNSVLQFYLGKLYYRLEMVDEALQLFSSLEGPHEQLVEFHTMLADLYQRKQQFQLSVEELHKAVASPRPLIIPYQCTYCQATHRKWLGRCNSCLHWNTLAVQPNGHVSTQIVPADQALSDPSTTPYPGIASPFETV